MDKILELKKIILDNIDLIFTEYNNIKKSKNNEILDLINDCNELRDCNKKLMNEISEKDKLLIINEKKMIDYEHMINHIQENAIKEKSEKERFDIIKKQDKEINDRDIEIKRLQRKVDSLEEKLRLFDNEKIKIDIEDINENNTIVEKIKHNQDLENTDTGQETESLSDLEEETPVIDNPNHNNHEEETPVIDNPNDNNDEEKTSVIDNQNNDEEDNISEEGEEVEIIKYYNKEYYIIVNESPQYIYTIDDGDLGDKVGEIKNSKKVFYKSSKN